MVISFHTSGGKKYVEFSPFPRTCVNVRGKQNVWLTAIQLELKRFSIYLNYRFSKLRSDCEVQQTHIFTTEE